MGNQNGTQKGRDMIELYKEDQLYLAIMHNDIPMIKSLKNKGFILSEHIVTVLTCPVGGAAKFGEYTMAWYGHIEAVRKIKGQKLIDVLKGLSKELGRQMYYSSAYSWEYKKSFYEPELFSCVLDCFDNRKIPKKKIWEGIMERDSAELAAIAAEHGWLKMPKRRDELIQYAGDNNKTECLAWLLDFKEKTADLAKEREMAEKRLMRELNANPDSVTELKKRFGFEKREDGTIIITSCKRGLGSSTEVIVPEKIGKDTVTAIGDYAFSSFASRLSKKCEGFRCQITEIKLPDTIKAIGKCAFEHCTSLKKINIPDGIEVINERTFSSCSKLEELHLPDSVKRIKDSAFNYCKALVKIALPHSLEQICGGTFAACTSLEEIELPKDLKMLGRYAFNSCVSLKEIEIPEGVEALYFYCFNHCSSMEKVVLHKGLKRIERFVFENCKSLKEIVIPEGVEEIGICSFAHCDSLERIYLPRSLKKLSNASVKDSPPLTVFHNSPRVTVLAYNGSYAEKYCKRNDIPYEIREEEND